MQLAVMAVPKMIILAITNQQIMITVTKASKHHRNLIVVVEKTEIIIEVIILMVNKRDVVVIVIIVVPETHVKIMTLEVRLVWRFTKILALSIWSFYPDSILGYFLDSIWIVFV